jgi:hypothetical protein
LSCGTAFVITTDILFLTFVAFMQMESKLPIVLEFPRL